MTKSENKSLSFWRFQIRISIFEFRVSFVIRHLSFVILGAAFCLPSATALSQVRDREGSYEILVSEPWTVHSSPAGGGTWMLKLANGDIINQYWETDGLHPYGLISSDKGKTWTRTTWPDDSACIAVLS